MCVLPTFSTTQKITHTERKRKKTDGETKEELIRNPSTICHTKNGIKKNNDNVIAVS